LKRAWEETLRLIDTNVFVYAVGAVHPLKQPSERILSEIVAGTLAANIDVEALQEILHVYSSRGERRKGFNALSKSFPHRERRDRSGKRLDDGTYLLGRSRRHPRGCCGPNQ
jgi:predicted nucleic acid-binding protein